MRRIPRTLFLVLALALLPVAGASAQSDDDGVHVDPNSPSAREYNIPVQSARDKSSGKSKKSGSSGSSTTSGSSGDDSSGGLFGQGVKPDDSSGDSGSSTTPSDSEKDSGTTGSTTTDTTTEAQAPTTTPPATSTAEASDPAGAAVAAADQGTGGTGPAVAFGVGGIVLLLAGLGGWLLKRRAL